MHRTKLLQNLTLGGLLSAGLLLGSQTIAADELPSASPEVIQQALTSGQPTLIDLGARSCIPCKEMAPILSSLSNVYRDRANVLFIDLNEHDAAAKTFRIQMIPTQIFFDAQGQEVKRHIGFMDEAALVAELAALGVE